MPDNKHRFGKIKIFGNRMNKIIPFHKNVYSEKDARQHLNRMCLSLYLYDLLHKIKKKKTF